MGQGARQYKFEPGIVVKVDGEVQMSINFPNHPEQSFKMTEDDTLTFELPERENDLMEAQKKAEFHHERAEGYDGLLEQYKDTLKRASEQLFKRSDTSDLGAELEDLFDDWESLKRDKGEGVESP